MTIKKDIMKGVYFLILFCLIVALIFVDVGWAEYSILQAKSIDEFAFHRSLLNIYDGLTNMDIRTTFSFGFFSYGFTWFLLNSILSFPFLAEAGNEYAIIIPRLLTSMFLIMSIIVVTKIENSEKKKYNVSAIFVMLFILSMPGMWLNAVWFHPDFAMSFIILCSFYFIVKAKTQFNEYYWCGIVMLGLALSIKLQAVTFGGALALFYVKNYIETKDKLRTVRVAIQTSALLVAVFILNNPYILHPIGFNAWLFSLEQNMISNATNHGAGDTTYFARLSEGVFNNFTPAITYFALFGLSVFYVFRDFYKKEADYLSYAGIYISSSFIYLLFFVNKTWGHYYIPLMLLSPLLLLSFVDTVSARFSNVKRARLGFLAAMLVSQFYIYGGQHFEFFQLRIQDKTMSRDSSLIVSRDDELAKADEVFDLLKKENFDEKSILASPYVNFPTNRLAVDFRNYHTIYGPLSETLRDRSLKNRKDFDIILISKGDIYFDDSQVSRMVEIDSYKTSKRLITEWLDDRSGYTLKIQNENYYIFAKKI
jgi:hypothetical protein